MATLQDRPPREAAPGKKWIRAPKVVDGIESYEWVEVDAAAETEWPARADLRLLNSDLRRVDGPEKVTGRARYAHDVRLPGMLYARLMCCPLPRAAVTLDLERARAIEGVQEVRALFGDGAEEGETRYLGQPVAVVAAETPELCEDALRAIGVNWEALAFAVTHAQATAADAPAVGRGGNVAEITESGDLAAAEAALEGCAAVVEAEYRLPVQHHACLETHGLVVEYDGGDEAVVHATTQGTFAVAGSVPGPLGLDAGQVVVQVPYMGGGFGSKFGIGVEGQTACELARDLSTSIHLLLPRDAEFLIAGNRSGAVQRVRAGVEGDGVLVAMISEIDQLGGLGRGSHAGLPYIYRAFESHQLRRAVRTHTDASRAFRAPGHPQASFAMESVLDELAYAAGVDLLAIRLANLPDAGRETYERQLARAAREIGWEAHPHKSSWDQSEALEKFGIGFGLSTWGGGGQATCLVDVRIARDGGVSALSGSQDLGTGTRTYVAAIVAEELGLPLAAVSARIGDSRYGRANASGGSTTTASLAPAVKHAAHRARLAFAAKLAEAGGVAVESIGFGGGKVRLGERELDWKEACALLGPDGVEARGEWQANLAANGVHGAQAARVRVDTLTGGVQVLKMVAVQDCGLPLNRVGLRSQINGGMIQALSYALFEERVIDPDLGYMLNANLEDYKIAGCREMPELVPVIDDGDTRQAVIGMAEPAVISGQSAIANAIHNACGVRVRELPITPDKVLMGLEALRSGGESS